MVRSISYQQSYPNFWRVKRSNSISLLSVLRGELGELDRLRCCLCAGVWSTAEQSGPGVPGGAVLGTGTLHTNIDGQPAPEGAHGALSTGIQNSMLCVINKRNTGPPATVSSFCEGHHLGNCVETSKIFLGLQNNRYWTLIGTTKKAVNL